MEEEEEEEAVEWIDPFSFLFYLVLKENSATRLWLYVRELRKCDNLVLILLNKYWSAVFNIALWHVFKGKEFKKKRNDISLSVSDVIKYVLFVSL